jgi:hypothetical protein
MSSWPLTSTVHKKDQKFLVESVLPLLQTTSVVLVGLVGISRYQIFLTTIIERSLGERINFNLGS